MVKKALTVLFILLSFSWPAFAFHLFSEVDKNAYVYKGSREWSEEDLKKSTEPADVALPAFTPSDIKLNVNGKYIEFPDQKPVMAEGRTYVPLRFFAEALGAEISWDEEHQVICIENKGIQYTTDDYGHPVRYYLRIGEPQLLHVTYYKQNVDYVKGVQIFDMPQAPVLLNGRTMLPFRCIGELLGALVYYDEETDTAIAHYGWEVPALSETNRGIRDMNYNNETGKFRTAEPVAILSTVTQDLFMEHLGYLRQTEDVKGKMTLHGEYSAAASWKVTDMFFNDGSPTTTTVIGDKLQAHYNSDGSNSASGFFKYHLLNKYTDSSRPALGSENLGGMFFDCPTGYDMINKESRADRYYLKDVDVKAYLDDCDYWYYRLHNMWGLEMFPLNDVPEEKTINGVDVSEYKVNNSVYSNNRFSALNTIKHWNEDIYRAIARRSLIDWINSPHGHKKTLVLTGTRYAGYGARCFEDEINFCFFVGTDYVLDEILKKEQENMKAIQ